MNHNHQIDSEHSDSINESRVYKVSHTRRWIEFSIVIIVVAVLAIIVIPTITTISKSADYSTAYTHSKDIVGAFEVAHADAQYESVIIPSTTITFTSNHLNKSFEPVRRIYILQFYCGTLKNIFIWYGKNKLFLQTYQNTKFDCAILLE